MLPSYQFIGTGGTSKKWVLWASFSNAGYKDVTNYQTWYIFLSFPPCNVDVPIKVIFHVLCFNANLLTDQGKTIVRKHLAATDAQVVWQELHEHMMASSKGASKKRRLTQYVTNTVLDETQSNLLFISTSSLGNWMRYVKNLRNSSSSQVKTSSKCC